MKSSPMRPAILYGLQAHDFYNFAPHPERHHIAALADHKFNAHPVLLEFGVQLTYIVSAAIVRNDTVEAALKLQESYRSRTANWRHFVLLSVWCWRRIFGLYSGAGCDNR